MEITKCCLINIVNSKDANCASWILSAQHKNIGLPEIPSLLMTESMHKYFRQLSAISDAIKAQALTEVHAAFPSASSSAKKAAAPNLHD